MFVSYFFFFFFFNDTATTEIYTLSYTLSLHDALPISAEDAYDDYREVAYTDRVAEVAYPRSRGARRSEEHTSELQSHSEISYAVFCLKKKKKKKGPTHHRTNRPTNKETYN